MSYIEERLETLEDKVNELMRRRDNTKDSDTSVTDQNVIWVARDPNGEVYIYSNKPELDSDRYFDDNYIDEGFFYEIDSRLLPDLTYENSPQKLALALDKGEEDVKLPSRLATDEEVKLLRQGWVEDKTINAEIYNALALVDYIEDYSILLGHTHATNQRNWCRDLRNILNRLKGEK